MQRSPCSQRSPLFSPQPALHPQPPPLLTSSGAARTGPSLQLRPQRRTKPLAAPCPLPQHQCCPPRAHPTGHRRERQPAAWHPSAQRASEPARCRVPSIEPVHVLQSKGGAGHGPTSSGIKPAHSCCLKTAGALHDAAHAPEHLSSAQNTARLAWLELLLTCNPPPSCTSMAASLPAGAHSICATRRRERVSPASLAVSLQACCKQHWNAS